MEALRAETRLWRYSPLRGDLRGFAPHPPSPLEKGGPKLFCQDFYKPLQDSGRRRLKSRSARLISASMASRSRFSVPRRAR